VRLDVCRDGLIGVDGRLGVRVDPLMGVGWNVFVGVRGHVPMGVGWYVLVGVDGLMGVGRDVLVGVAMLGLESRLPHDETGLDADPQGLKVALIFHAFGTHAQGVPVDLVVLGLAIPRISIHFAHGHHSSLGA
jgi:hypothetical protein